jgi:hypothetical protein
MRYLNIVAVLFFVLLAAGCADRRAYTVATDLNRDADVDFAQYQSFTFAEQLMDENKNEFFMRNSDLKENLKDAVMHEMKARGYDKKDGEGDLIVNFRVIEEPMQMTGFPNNTMADNAGFWGTGEVAGATGAGADAGLGTAAGGVDAATGQVTYNLEKGSILVQMVDRETGLLVWQGHATGITDEENIDNKSIRQAVSLIFDEFTQRADDL